MSGTAPRPTVVGFDLGGTHLRAAATDGADLVGRTAWGPVAAPSSLDAFVATVRQAIAELSRAGRPTGVGVTVPGLVDGTVVRWVPNLPYLDGVDLADLLGDLADAVVVLNDAHAALLAESTAGAAQGADVALLLAVGTGIGSAVLAGGRIVRGAHGAACSFGWACADVADPGDDRHGWLERHASGTALDDLARHSAVAGDGAGLVAAARAGDGAAIAAVGRAGSALGAALAGAIGLLDPAVVVVSGGVAAALDVLEPAVRACLHRQLPEHLRTVPIVAGDFGPHAGLVGALVAAGRGATWWEAP